MADVKSRVSAAPTAAKPNGTDGKPFAPTIEIRLKGGGLNPGILEAIKNRQLAFTTDEGTLVDGTVTVRSMYALEIQFNAQERSKIKLMWDILELLFLEGEGLNSLLTSGTRWSLEKVGLERSLMCVRVIEERRRGDVVEYLRPSEISKMPQYGGPLILTYFATIEDRNRVEATGALVTCWLGKEEQDCILLGCGQIREAATDRVQEVGIAAACKLLRERVVVQYAASEQLVGKANNLLTWAMGDGVGSPTVSGIAQRSPGTSDSSEKHTGTCDVRPVSEAESPGHQRRCEASCVWKSVPTRKNHKYCRNLAAYESHAR